MSYTNIKKEDLINKYNDILKYFCYNKQDKLCNKLSYDKSGYCEDCVPINIKDDISNESNKSNNLTNKDLIAKFTSNESVITKEIKLLLDKHVNNTDKSDNEPLKEFRAKNVINIFDIIYHNIFFTLIQPKFLITIINKISEILNLDKDFIYDLCDKKNYKIYIYCFMIDIYEFIKNYETKNNYLINNDMNIDNFELFLNKFIIFLQNYYDNICLQNKKIDSINDININNCDNFQIVLEL